MNTPSLHPPPKTATLGMLFSLTCTMRIGIDGRMFRANFTGIGRYTFELVKHLVERCPEHTFVVFFNEPEFHTCPLDAPNLQKVLVNAKHYSLREQTIFLKKIQEAKIDLMHFTHFNAPIFYFGPSIVTIHDLTLSFFPGKKMTKWIHRKGYEWTLSSIVHKAKAVIAVSENTKKDLVRLFPGVEQKTNVIYEAADPSFTVITDQEILSHTTHTYHLDKPFLLYTGVWRDHKNVVGLLRAFHLLRTTYQLDYDLVITGKEDPHYPEVKEVTKELGLTDHVRFLGLVPEDHLRALYSLAQVYVFPSFYEGFGLPPLEAMASGTPVASSNSSCLPEICGEENALFFDPYNIEEMAATIHKVCTDEFIRTKLITNGLRRVQEFSWTRMAEETLAVYQRVLSL